MIWQCHDQLIVMSLEKKISYDNRPLITTPWNHLILFIHMLSWSSKGAKKKTSKFHKTPLNYGQSCTKPWGFWHVMHNPRYYGSKASQNHIVNQFDMILYQNFKMLYIHGRNIYMMDKENSWILYVIVELKMC